MKTGLLIAFIRALASVAGFALFPNPYSISCRLFSPLQEVQS